jgi:Uma2 family endonuclease
MMAFGGTVSMSVTLEPHLTLDEFLALLETKPASEFWNGQVRQKPMPSTKQSAIQLKLGARLDSIAESTAPRLGRVMTKLRCTFAGRSVVPDIAYVRRDRLPLGPNGRLADRYVAAPDLMVGIVSPEQSSYDLIEKVAWCVQNGVQLAWLIDPVAEEVMLFSPGSVPRVVPRDSALDGGEVVPGFRCPLAEVFGWLREAA